MVLKLRRPIGFPENVACARSELIALRGDPGLSTDQCCKRTLTLEEWNVVEEGWNAAGEGGHVVGEESNAGGEEWNVAGEEWNVVGEELNTFEKDYSRVYYWGAVNFVSDLEFFLH